MIWILLDFSSYFSLVHIFFHNVFYSISSMFSFDWFNLSIILFGISHLYSEYWKINRNSFRFGRKKEFECRKNAAAVVHLSGKLKNSSECEKKNIMVSDGKLQIFHCSFFVDSTYEGRGYGSRWIYKQKRNWAKHCLLVFHFPIHCTLCFFWASKLWNIQIVILLKYRRKAKKMFSLLPSFATGACFSFGLRIVWKWAPLFRRNIKMFPLHSAVSLLLLLILNRHIFFFIKAR